MTSVEHALIARDDIDHVRVANMVADHGAAMSANVALGERINEQRIRLVSLRRQLEQLSQERADFLERNRSAPVPDRLTRQIASIESQVEAGDSVQQRTRAQRTVAIGQAATLGTLLGRAREALAGHGIELEILDPFATGESGLRVGS